MIVSVCIRSNIYTITNNIIISYLIALQQQSLPIYYTNNHLYPLIYLALAMVSLSLAIIHCICPISTIYILCYYSVKSLHIVFLALATTTDINLLIYIEFPIPLFLLYFQILIIIHPFVYTIYTIINVFL